MTQVPERDRVESVGRIGQAGRAEPMHHHKQADPRVDRHGHDAEHVEGDHPPRSRSALAKDEREQRDGSEHHHDERERVEENPGLPQVVVGGRSRGSQLTPLLGPEEGDQVADEVPGAPAESAQEPDDGEDQPPTDPRGAGSPLARSAAFGVGARFAGNGRYVVGSGIDDGRRRLRRDRLGGRIRGLRVNRLGDDRGRLCRLTDGRRPPPRPCRCRRSSWR